MSYARQQGFTLIEILIAGVILFSVIAVVTQSYRSAVTSSEKATRSVEVLSIAPLLLDTIRFRLRDIAQSEPQSQTGVMEGFVFEWRAEIIKQGSAPPRFSVEDDGVINFSQRYFLWQVELTLKKDSFERHYSFKEFTWIDR